MSERAPRSAKRMMMASRAPLAVLVEKQRARLAKLDERIGCLMTQRVDEEEILADLLTEENKRNASIARYGADGE
jgi:hypothetical protein